MRVFRSMIEIEKYYFPLDFARRVRRLREEKLGPARVMAEKAIKALVEEKITGKNSGS